MKRYVEMFFWSVCCIVNSYRIDLKPHCEQVRSPASLRALLIRIGLKRSGVRRCSGVRLRALLIRICMS